LRPVVQADRELAERWFIDFSMEALGEADFPEIQKSVNRRIREGTLYLWEDGRPVSMAGCGRPLAHGVAVGPVYTPPEFRCQGYATACVATLSSQLLAQGWQYCNLFTNLANPISNAVYQRIGYQPVADYTEYDFTTGVQSAVETRA
jgi:uncharacterized protein